MLKQNYFNPLTGNRDANWQLSGKRGSSCRALPVCMSIGSTGSPAVASQRVNRLLYECSLNATCFQETLT